MQRLIVNFSGVMSITGLALDLVGVMVVAVGSLFSLVRFLLRGTAQFGESYRLLREDVGRAILLGLEFLIAGDIIRSVVVDPTIQNILTLAHDRSDSYVPEYDAPIGS